MIEKDLSELCALQDDITCLYRSGRALSGKDRKILERKRVERCQLITKITTSFQLLEGALNFAREVALTDCNACGRRIS